MTSGRRIVLLRHGRTADNAAGRIQGWLDTPLDELGHDQAAAAAEVLSQGLAPGDGAASPGPLRPGGDRTGGGSARSTDGRPGGGPVLLTSDLVRASATAAAVERRTGLGALADARLRELRLGSWQGLTGEQAQAAHPEEHAAWRRGEDVPRGGGETYAEAGARAVACLLEHLTTTLVAVTHGGTARAALGLLLDLPPDAWWRLVPLGNARWSVLVETDRGWRLEQHNAGVGSL